MTYRLSRKAEEDIIALYVDGAARFGVSQAEDYYAGLEGIFAFLAEFPHAARERPELSPPVRIHPYRSHIVVYVIDKGAVVIVRVRHGREAWEAAD